MTPTPLRFVGRDDELKLLAEVLADASLPPVIYLHGPAGIGKTALVRELEARDGRRWNWFGDDLANPADPPAHPSVTVVDDHLPGRDQDLMDTILATLPAGSRVLVVSRRPPGPAWRSDEWEAVLREVPLGPMTDEDADQLARAGGVSDPFARTALVEWSRGEPVPLISALERYGDDFETAQAGADPGLAEEIWTRLLKAETDGNTEQGERALELASVARGVDTAMLDEMLAGADAGETLAWLEALSVTRLLGSRVSLDDRLRWALRTRMLSTDPGNYRELRRRLADHAASRASRGEPHMLLELTELIDDPALSWALGSEAGADFRAEPARPGDFDAVSRALNRPGRLKSLRPWFEDAPEHVLSVRHRSGWLGAIAIAVGVGDVPAWAEADPQVGPWLEYARFHHDPDEAVLLRDALILAEGELRGAAASVGNAAIVTGRGFNARWFYVLIEPDEDDKVAFVDAMGYDRRHDLDVSGPDFSLHGYVLDLGRGGFVAATHALVYRQLGLEPPGDTTGLTRSDVVEALRSFHEPSTLVSSPLADGNQPVDEVRRRLRGALDLAFGDDEHDRLLRSTVEGGYLEPESSHASTARLLHLSRATYFRRLSEAVDRITAELVDPG